MASEIKVGIPKSAFFSAIGVLIMMLGTFVNNTYLQRFNGIDKHIEKLSMDATADRELMNKSINAINVTLATMNAYIDLRKAKPE